ncbi:MAG: ABC transporter substrate-binding protein [Acidobacteria bacterium RIFCSPLOWO2_02_FULL_60_20]|nr:MAG: ABC transporter substrate-binding protein [Acidobacteria bacterium RIFCSPLOWO2_02_FULL_60_20]
MAKREITIAHSPDSDDAFMFYALATSKVTAPGLEFRHCLKDIETLNREAHRGVWDVTAISFHAYPYISDRYVLMACGGSLGDGYGPMVVSQRALTPEQLKGKKIAVPGKLTTAYLTMKIFEPEFEAVVVPFDKILEAVEEGSVDAGLLIHEGQLTFRRQGLHLVMDLGRWWKDQFALPLPLGGNAIRREWEKPFREQINGLLRESIQYALDHRQEAMSYALSFARDMEPELADRFVGMYVNGYTLDYGEKGRRAIETLFDLGYQKGLLPSRPVVEF